MKKFLFVSIVVMVLLVACQPKVVEKVVKETVIIEKEVEVEKVVKETVEVEKVVTRIVEKRFYHDLLTTSISLDGGEDTDLVGIDLSVSLYDEHLVFLGGFEVIPGSNLRKVGAGVWVSTSCWASVHYYEIRGALPSGLRLIEPSPENLNSGNKLKVMGTHLQLVLEKVTPTSTSTNTPVPPTPTLTLTPTPISTSTSTSTLQPTSTPTQLPTTQVVVAVEIQGLGEAEKECLTLHFHDDKDTLIESIALIEALRSGEVLLSREPAWVEVKGSTDGSCPWDNYNLVDPKNEALDAKRVEVTGKSLTLRFERSKEAEKKLPAQTRKPSPTPWSPWDVPLTVTLIPIVEVTLTPAPDPGPGEG